MNRTSFVHLALITVVCAVGSQPAAAEDTRAESASAERAAKAPAQTSEADLDSGVFQRAFAWINNMEDAGGAKDGLYPQLGGMIPGSGLATGPGYRQHLFGDAAVVDASAAISWRRYSMMQSKIEWPALFSNDPIGQRRRQIRELHRDQLLRSRSRHREERTNRLLVEERRHRRIGDRAPDRLAFDWRTRRIPPRPRHRPGAQLDSSSDARFLR